MSLDLKAKSGESSEELVLLALKHLLLGALWLSSEVSLFPTNKTMMRNTQEGTTPVQYLFP